MTRGGARQPDACKQPPARAAQQRPLRRRQLAATAIAGREGARVGRDARVKIPNAGHEAGAQHSASSTALWTAPAGERTILAVDVIPVVGGQYRASCTCGAKQVFAEQPAAWRWLLDHPCPLID